MSNQELAKGEREGVPDYHSGLIQGSMIGAMLITWALGDGDGEEWRFGN